MKIQHPVESSAKRRSSPKWVPAMLLALLVPTLAVAGGLTIEVSGVAPGRGKIYIAVYDREASFPTAGRQLVGKIVDAVAGHVTARFEDLPPGEYAAVAFQDFNGNGKLDKNLLGIPKEPYGFSNGARGSAGPPKFSAAMARLDPDGMTRIELK